MTAIVPSRVVSACRLVALVQARTFFPHIVLGTAVLTIAILRWLVPADYWPSLAPAFILGEPAMLGFLFAASHRYLEENEGCATALVVTPLLPAEHLLAMTLVPAVWATGAALILQAGLIGFDYRLGLLVAPIFVTALMFGLAGLCLSAWVSDFQHFIFAQAPLQLMLLSPMLAHFGVTSVWAFAWSPATASILAFAEICSASPSLRVIGLATTALVLATAVLAAITARVFARRVRPSLETSV